MATTSPVGERVSTTSEAAGDDRNVWTEAPAGGSVSLVDRPLKNLKQGDAFAVMDSNGDLGVVPGTAEGLYYRDTRHLSRYELHIEGRRAVLLSSIMHEDKAALSVDLTNPEVQRADGTRLLRDTIFVGRTRFLWEAACYERLKLKNFGSVDQTLTVGVDFDTDFKDLFEVRGMVRHARGTLTSSEAGPDAFTYVYHGLDGVVRRSTLHFQPTPTTLRAGRALFDVHLGAGQSAILFVTVSFEVAQSRTPVPFFHAYRELRRSRRASTAKIATVTSSNALFNEVVCRATSDVYTLVTDTEFGPYPYAGIPWFSTMFGRDGIITALLMLWVDPSLAAGVLRALAATQATSVDPAADAQPGKILHETRHGEMADLGEVPFKRYYGTVDATPLFLVLAAAYFERTGDRALIDAIWPNIEAALNWIDVHGDADGDGFVEYMRATETGLQNQGWKDSHDSIFHADGRDASGAIALCEVQGYVYAAKTGVSAIAAATGRDGLASRLAAEAEELRQAFERAYWCQEIGTYAIALDGDKSPCRIRASNAGHALFSGIAGPDRARQVAETLMAPESFSGWGVRTLATSEARYNPISYHNGSVWPHDNALIAIGLARYGFKADAARILEGVFSTATHQESRRLPELFCGFIRRPHRGPTAYPVACSPQAWAAAAPFGLLGACLGLSMSSKHDQIQVTRPVLPSFLDDVALRDLRVGSSTMDARFHRYGDDVTTSVMRRSGSCQLVLTK